jgi:hypothetical protein
VAFAYQTCFEANPFRYIAFVMLVALASYLGATVFVTLFPVEQWASRWWLARVAFAPSNRTLLTLGATLLIYLTTFALLAAQNTTPPWLLRTVVATLAAVFMLPAFGPLMLLYALKTEQFAGLVIVGFLLSGIWVYLLASVVGGFFDSIARRSGQSRSY